MLNNYKFLMSIRNGVGLDKDWIYSFNENFSFWLNDFDKIGRFQYLSLDEVQKTFKNASWFNHTNKCPYLPKIVGYINWEWWANEDDTYEDKQSMVLEWMSFGNGYMVRTDTEKCFDLIKILSYPLNDIQKVQGFDQGQVFLKNLEDDYILDLKQKILFELKEKGISRTFPKNYSTGRNELYIPELMPREEIESETLEFWGLDIMSTDSDLWKEFLIG